MHENVTQSVLKQIVLRPVREELSKRIGRNNVDILSA